MKINQKENHLDKYLYSLIVDIPAKLILTPPKIIYWQEGDNGMFNCPFKGSPPPVLIFYHNEVSINTSSPRYKSISNGMLMIANVTRSDEGIYECEMISINNTSTYGAHRSNLTRVIIYGKHF